MMKKRAGTLMALAVALGLSLALTAHAADLDALFEGIKGYKFGESRAQMTEISDLVRDSRPGTDERAALLKGLAGLLEGEASYEARQFACRMLSQIGEAGQVPVVARYLTDAELSHMACYALERIPGDEAAAALRAALPRAEGLARLGIINAIGQKADAQATAALTDLLKSPDADVVRGAAAALGKIGTTDAAKALEAALAQGPAELRPAFADATLQAAYNLAGAGEKDAAAGIFKRLMAVEDLEPVRVSAFIGAVELAPEAHTPLVADMLKGDDVSMRSAAVMLIRETPVSALAEAAVAVLPTLDDPLKVSIITALAHRKVASARPMVSELTGDDNEESVRLAAISALSALGDAGSVEMLAALATEGGAIGRSAVDSLTLLTGDGVDDAILARVKGGDADQRRALIPVVEARNSVAAVPDLLALARDEDEATRQAALRALGALSGPEHLEALIDLVLAARSQNDADAAARAFTAAAAGADQAEATTAAVRAFKGATDAPKVALATVLAQLGGDSALAALTEAMDTDQREVKSAIIRALTAWPTDASAAPLLTLAADSEAPLHRILALQGYIAVAGRSSASDADKVAMFAKGLELATRVEEKRAVLGELAKLKSDEALAMARGFADDEEVKEEAQSAVEAIEKNRQ